MLYYLKWIISKIARILIHIPIIGRFVRIGIAVIRLPLLKNHIENQIPKLLQSFSELNHRQQILDNFVNSIPVTLRNYTRELNIHSKSINELYGRTEFIRRELLFEMKYGANQTNIINPKIENFEIKIINEEKLSSQKRTGLKLNLGCGHIPLDNYLNIDQRNLPGIDIVAQAVKLPFADGEIEEIFSAHFLEHFPQEELKRSLLPYYFRLLKKGGLFRAVVPDAEAMMQAYKKGDYEFEKLRNVTFGGQDYDGDFHFNMFTPTSLTEILTEIGFREIEVVESGRRNGDCFEFELLSVKI